MNDLNFTILCADIAESYGLELCQAEAVCTITGVTSIEELDSRYIGHFSVYNNLDELTHDIYELYCENIPFKIIHNLIISDEPLREIEEL